ncbi:hypothetical protein Pcinc_024320 [Petrolisthes cinctipes]|uniref:Uncharacterized protein n=1 Tax=Petrolisthes cinctipes TaxID=88211 RepID=A0AAE1FCX8_PETCI|nr:hypothetical protein Pcinc_024320 [Petrolisthes cinctipes]
MVPSPSSRRMHQFGSTGIPASRRDTDTRSPLDDDDEEDLINPGSPNTFEDDISEDEVSLDARSPPPPPLPPSSQPPTSSSHSISSPPRLHGPPTSLPLSLDPKILVCRRSPSLVSPTAKDTGGKDGEQRVSPGVKDETRDIPKTALTETTPPIIPTSLQALAPALTIASLVSSHKRPASPQTTTSPPSDPSQRDTCSATPCSP